MRGDAGGGGDDKRSNYFGKKKVYTVAQVIDRQTE